MGASALLKICPECREEYKLRVVRCAHCDVDLVLGDSEALQQAPAEVLPSVDQLVCVRVAPLAWIRALSDGLQQEAVLHRVEAVSEDAAPADQRVEIFDGQPLFGLYVKSDHEGVAKQLDASIASQLSPEEAPPLETGELEACPACGHSLDASALSCEDCGLEFG